MPEKTHIVTRHPLTPEDPSPVRQALCVFERTGDDRTLQAMPQRPFRPSGLLLWDVPDSATVMAFIGTDLQSTVTYHAVPARWYAHWRSFAEVARAVAEGFEPAGWGEWAAVHPGVLIRLQFSEPAPNVQAVMWGHTVKL